MVSKFRRLALGATLAVTIFVAPGCSLLAGGATGAGVGAIAGSTMILPAAPLPLAAWVEQRVGPW